MKHPILILCLLAFTPFLRSAEPEASVFIQAVHEEPNAQNEDPQDFMEISKGEQVYHCASLGNWKWITQTYQMDVAALHPDNHAGFVGVRTNPIPKDSEGKPITQLTRELIIEHLKTLYPTTSFPTEELPEFKEPVTSIGFEMKHARDNEILKCGFRFELAQNELLVCVCESSEKDFPSFQQAFSTLAATFNRIPSKPTTLSIDPSTHTQTSLQPGEIAP